MGGTPMPTCIPRNTCVPAMSQALCRQSARLLEIGERIDFGPRQVGNVHGSRLEPAVDETRINVLVVEVRAARGHLALESAEQRVAGRSFEPLDPDAFAGSIQEVD